MSGDGKKLGHLYFVAHGRLEKFNHLLAESLKLCLQRESRDGEEKANGEASGEGQIDLGSDERKA